ncbi:MAG: thioredoxin-dependent thiol peroxidase [Bacteroidetes bacterium]|nr:thioredoxin-dependent thiol peroxidase [Bacteroidota bacterium]
MTTLKVGSIAPLFSSVDQAGNDINLESLRGQKVILYFYPKDDTPGCTAEACSLRDGFSILKKNGYVIIGVSPDNSAKHLKFIDKYNLPFPLIPDSDKNILKAYEVWGPKKFMGKSYDGVIRTTFVIDENGIINKIITKVDTKNHFDQLVKELGI